MVMLGLVFLSDKVLMVLSISRGEKINKQTYQLVTPIFGITYNDFVFSYNYSYQKGNIVLGNGGFHQITLGYNIDLFN